MKNIFSLSSSAFQDLKDVRDYSLSTWGKELTKVHLEKIYSSFKTIGAFNHIGKRVHEFEGGGEEIYLFNSDKYLIYYTLIDDAVIIVRILDNKRDIKNIFNS